MLWFHNGTFTRTPRQPQTTLRTLFSSVSVHSNAKGLQTAAIPGRRIKLPLRTSPPLLHLLAAAGAGHSERQIQHNPHAPRVTVLKVQREPFPTLHFENSRILEQKNKSIGHTKKGHNFFILFKARLLGRDRPIRHSTGGGEAVPAKTGKVMEQGYALGRGFFFF